MLLILLFIIFIILLICSYFMFKKDILNPAVIFLATYTISIFSALINIKKWEINFRINSFLILLLGAIEFLLINYYVYKKNINKNNKYVKIEKQKNKKNIKSDVEKVKSIKWKVIIASLYGIIVTLILLYNVFEIANQYGEFNSLSEALSIFKKYTSYSVQASLPFYLKWMQKPMYAFAYIFLYYYLKEVIINTKNEKLVFFKKIYILIPTICFSIQEFLSSNRLSILSVLIAAFTMCVILWYNKYEWKKVISIKKIAVLSVMVIIGLVLFYFSAEFVGRKNNKNMIDYVTVYTGGSVECFNRFMQDNKAKPKLVGEETFYYFVKNLYDYKIIKLDSFYPIHLEFRDLSTGETIGNVYTAYRRWIHDFGIFGAFLLNGLMALIYSTFYYYIKNNRQKKHIDFGIIMYGYLAYPLFLHCIDGYFYLLTVRIAFITTSLMFVVIYLFVNGMDFNKNRKCMVLKK